MGNREQERWDRVESCRGEYKMAVLSLAATLANLRR